MTMLRVRAGRARRVAQFIVLLTAMATTLAVAQEEQAKIGAAIEVAEGWLALLDDGQYDSSWETAATVIQQAMPKDEWGPTIRQARGPFEPFGERELVQSQFLTTLPNMPEGEYVVLAYATDTAQGKVLETVVPMLEDGEWRVAGYFVRPRN